ncbi:DUF488 family protein [Texcoconibacillus texcoconensis]|uniref:Uncharacterized protein YeaO (DUF488 family) n=1 Tax=Texcoconibacillus texcoconensis TaxID=1095777 RepID=A0A840QMH4_9BACI|nr:uncharacterized protein YeaO (DUF488 family) [Texcoconibacillus texcoconensis]
MGVKIKRAYEQEANEDGVRILVDRVWPRGLSKEKLQIDEWMKEVAPSKELRKWFGHDPEKFEQFKTRYLDELNTDPLKQECLEKIRRLKSNQVVTLVQGARDEKHNQAVVLKKVLDEGAE